MGKYDFILVILGLSFLGAAVLPRLVKDAPLSLPMFYVASGLLIPTVWLDLPHIDPIEYGLFTERLAEGAVIISLMSAGLKLDRQLGWRAWNSTWRLLAVTMPICIAALAVGGMWVLGLPLSAAVLLGAVVAPTDPVLASDVQVGPPGTGDENEARFALTSEAGLNDGLAFPFVNLAIVLAATGLARHGLVQWLTIDVAWKILSGVFFGALIGRGVAVLVFRVYRPSAVGEGFMAIALTLLAYGGTELIHGYGFIGVFVAAIMFRRVERNHEYHQVLHDFSEQTERLLMVVVLILFGAAIAHGLLNGLTLPAVLLALAFVIVIRPFSGMIGLIGTEIPRAHRAVIATFGIRGIGTFYYLAYGLNQSNIAETHGRTIWGVAGVIVLTSIVLHGMTASHAMRRIK